MSVEAFKGFALFVWTRHRFLIVGYALIYAAVFFAYDTLWVLEGKPHVGSVLAFLRMAPFFLPLLLCTSTVNVGTTDLATRDSWYPRQFFTLPLTTREIVLPFIVYTIGLYALLWILGIGISGGRILVAGPLDAPIEALQRQNWAPFLPLAVLAWIQALIWLPFRRRGSRIALLLGVVTAFFFALIVAARSGATDSVIIGGSLLLVVAAYLIGIAGVARARRGDVWQERDVPRQRILRPRGTERPFGSGLAAQSWCEANVQRTRAGFVATFFVPFLLLIVLVVTLVLGRNEPAATALGQRALTLLVWILGIVALASGPSFAAFDATVQSFKNDGFRMPSFFAALPLSTGHFAWAKLRTAAKRMAFVASVVLIGAIAISQITGISETWSAPLAALRARYGGFEVGVLLALAAIALPLFTAAATANVVWIALVGRGWKIASVVIMIVFASIVFVPGWAAADPARLETAVATIRTLLPMAAAVKVASLALLIYAVGSRRLYSWSRIGSIGAAWLVVVGALLVLYFRYVPEGLATLTMFASAVILLTPILGIIAAPLALHLNRCR